VGGWRSGRRRSRLADRRAAAGSCVGDHPPGSLISGTGLGLRSARVRRFGIEVSIQMNIRYENKRVLLVGSISSSP
jgi:hypothetical protein